MTVCTGAAWYGTEMWLGNCKRKEDESVNLKSLQAFKKT